MKLEIRSIINPMYIKSTLSLQIEKPAKIFRGGILNISSSVFLIGGTFFYAFYTSFMN